MSDREFDVRGEIMKAISATDDAKDRSMLMLMLNVLERVERLLSDDEAMRKIVLNGNYERHADDHAWLAEWRDHVDEWRDVCVYSKTRMQEELKSKSVKEVRARKIIDKMLEHLVTIVLTGVAMYLGFVR